MEINAAEVNVPIQTDIKTNLKATDSKGTAKDLSTFQDVVNKLAKISKADQDQNVSSNGSTSNVAQLSNIGTSVKKIISNDTSDVEKEIENLIEQLADDKASQNTGEKTDAKSLIQSIDNIIDNFKAVTATGEKSILSDDKLKEVSDKLQKLDVNSNDLMTLLLSLYTNKDQSTGDLVQNTGNNVSNVSNEGNSSLSAIMNMLSNAKDAVKSVEDAVSIPDSMKTILQKFESLAEKKLNNLPLGNLSGNDQNSTEANVKELMDFKQSVINQLISIVKESSDSSASAEVPKTLQLIEGFIKNIEGKSKNIDNAAGTTNATDLQAAGESFVNTSDNKKVADNNSLIDNVQVQQQNVQRENTKVIDLKPADSTSLQGNAQQVMQSDDSKISTADKKEDSFLAAISGEKNDNKDTSKLSLLMNNLRASNENPATVSVKGQVQQVNRQTFVSDVIKTVKYMETNNLKELTVKINPKELGEITISLTMEEGKLKADISAHSKEAYGVLSSNFQDLKNSVGSNQQIKIQDFNISIYNGDTTFFKDGSQNNGSQQQKFSASNTKGVEADDEIDSINENSSQSDSQIDMLA